MVCILAKQLTACVAAHSPAQESLVLYCALHMQTLVSELLYLVQLDSLLDCGHSRPFQRGLFASYTAEAGQSCTHTLRVRLSSCT